MTLKILAVIALVLTAAHAVIDVTGFVAPPPFTYAGEQ